MFNEVPEKEREKKLIDGGLDISRLVNIELVNREGNAVIRRHLESLPLESFDSVSNMYFLIPHIRIFLITIIKIWCNKLVYQSSTNIRKWYYDHCLDLRSGLALI